MPMSGTKPGTDKQRDARIRLTEVVPDWLVNLSALGWRIVVIALLAIVIGQVLSIFWIVTASVAVAALIAGVFGPNMVRLRKSGRSRNAAALIVWGQSLIAVGILVAIVALALLPFLAEVVRLISAGVSQVTGSLNDASAPPAVSALLQAAFQAVLQLASGPFVTIIGSIVSAGTVLILAIFLVFFFLRDGDKAWLWIFQGVSDDKRTEVTAAGRDALTRVATYIRVTTTLSAIAAATNFVFMLVLGLPYALPVSLLVFLAGYIPYFGSILATTAVLLLALSASGPTIAGLMLLLIVARSVVVRYTIRPASYSRTAGLSAAVALVALAAGYQVAGLVGVISAIPVTATILALAPAVRHILEPDEPAPEPAPKLIPNWLDTLAQYSARLLVVIAVAALAVGLLVTLPLVIIPLLGGLIIAATLDPIVVGLIARGWSRTAASTFSVIGALIAIVALLIVAVVALPGNVSDVSAAVTGGGADVNASAGGNLGLAQDGVKVLSLATARAVASAVEAFVAIATIGALSALLGFYFLRDGGRIWQAALGRMAPGAAEEVRAAGQRAFDALGGYMLGTAAVSFVGAASQWLIMVLLGLPYAVPVFILSFLLCFIPYVGGYVSTGIAFLIAVHFGTPLDIAIMFAWTMVFNIVQGNILAPIVYGKTVHIHPAIVLMAVPAGAAVAGIAGMFLAVPAAGVVAGTWRSLIRIIGGQANAADETSADAKEMPPEPAVATGPTVSEAPA